VVPGLWHRRGDVAAVVSLAEERLGKPPPVCLLQQLQADLIGRRSALGTVNGVVQLAHGGDA
jgi:hypothetical protein